MAPTNPVRGMRDILPADKARRERILRSIRATYRSHGFAEIEAPCLESLEHLLSDQGGENEKMLYKVQKRGLTPAQLQSATTPDELCDIGLRYDLTVGLTRYYANNRGKIPPVFRAMNIGPVWRAERPQKGRYRQFTQCDIDILGETTALAEVELIAATVKALAALGLTDLTLKLNDRRLLAALLREARAPEEAFARALIAIDKLDKIGVAGVVEELNGFLSAATVTRLESAITAFEDPEFDTAQFAKMIPSPEVADVIANLDKIFGALATITAGKVHLRFAGSLVRGMGYYSGPIFELWHPDFGSAVAGGGRYDGLAGRLTGTDVAACGFSIGFERIVDLVDLPSADEPEQVAIVYDPSVDWGTLLQVQEDWVSRDHAARLVPRPKRLGPVLDSLLAEGFTAWVEVAADGTASGARPLRTRD